MRKFYLLLILISYSFLSYSQSECSTAVTASVGTNTQAASPDDNYYWYEFTMPESGGKLKIELPSSEGVYLYSDCGGELLSAFSNTLIYTEAEPNDVLKIRIGAGNAEAFDWTLEVTELQAGDNCDLAVEAIEGTNTMPAEEGQYYWYKFTMPDLDDTRIYFDWPFMVDATIFRGACDNLTDESNVSGGSGFYITGYEANEELYIRLNLSGETNFEWTIEVEVPEVGQDCSIADSAALGTNSLPATEMEEYWYKYTTPADVSGKKLQANSRSGVEMSVYMSNCYNSSVVQTRDSAVFALEPEPETDYYFKFNNLTGGDFDWTLSLTDPVAGDICDDPIIVEEGQYQADFTPQWYSFTATEAGTYEISSTVESSDKDTILKIYDSCGGAIRAENDDASNSTYQSEISLELQADETILILWESGQFETEDGFTWNVYNAARQQITFSSLPEKTFGDETFELDASSSAGLEISYTSSNLEVATIDGNIVTIVGAGESIITASQSGNNEFEAAIPVEQTLTVNKADQEITISEISDKFSNEDSFEVEASTTSGLDLTYEVNGPATIEGTTLTLDGTLGTVELIASQAGNSNYNSASASVSFEVLEDPCLDFNASATVTNVSCSGSEDGKITVETTEGTEPFSYSLDEAEAVESNVFSELAAGEYTIEVTDINGCTASTNVTIESPDALEIEAEVVNSNSITGNGSISLSVTGGTGDYSFNWNTDATTSSIDELEIGEYTVIVTDENGCSLEESYTVGGVTSNDKSLSNSILIYPNPAKDILQMEHSHSSKELSIYDAKGKFLKKVSTEGTQTEINVSQLPSGLYFVRADGASQLHRFVKQ
ncbi:MAG: T9SS type A sorting domain-containing protein [Bacteroidota bacterium]